MQRTARRNLAETRTYSVGIILLLTTAAAGLRLLFLGAKSLDLDEAFSIALVRKDWGSFLHSLAASEGHMVLYYILLRFWRLLGENEAIIRTLSVLPAVATVPVLYALGKRLFGVRVALVAATLLACNAYHVKYAQEARGYSLVVLFTTLSSYFLVRSMEERSRNGWRQYVLSSILAVYSHVYGFLVLASQWVALVFFRRRDIQTRPFLFSIAIIGAALIPLSPSVWTRAGEPMSHSARLSNIPGVFYVLAGGAGRLGDPEAAGIALIVAYLGLCLLAVAGARAHAGTEKATKAWRSGLLVTWLCLPVMLAFGIAFAMPRIAFTPYYVIVSLPPFVLLAAAGLASIRRQPVFISILVAIVALSAYETYVYYRYFQKEDFRGATYRLLSLASPGDAVLFYAPYGRDGFDYYRDRVPGAPPVTILSNWQDWPDRYSRIWLVVNSGYDTRAIEAALARAYSSSREWTFPGIRLLLYDEPRQTRKESSRHSPSTEPRWRGSCPA